MSKRQAYRKQKLVVEEEEKKTDHPQKPHVYVVTRVLLSAHTRTHMHEHTRASLPISNDCWRRSIGL